MIDLYSDTLTQPSPAMRRAMGEALVGDEQRREDPSTNRLQQMAADVLGKAAAVFLPSGSMCNAVAIRTHTQSGDALICDRMAHIYRAEFGSAATLSGVTTEPIDGENGIFTVDQLREALSRFHHYGAVPRLVCLEQTHNYGGGAIWPMELIAEVCALAHERGLKTHLDGARLFNACVATGIPASEVAKHFDSVWIDLSKGLGCPVGAVLAGDADFIARAWRFKHLLGGAMRQSGILAAAGIHALQNNVERLREDHANAQRLAEGLSAIRRIRVETTHPPTNIVFFDISSAGIAPADFHEKCHSAGVRFSGVGARVRAVTHLDVSADDIDRAVEVVRRVVG